MRVPDEGYSRNASCALNSTCRLLLNATCFIYVTGHKVDVCIYHKFK